MSPKVRGLAAVALVAVMTTACSPAPAPAPAPGSGTPTPSPSAYSAESSPGGSTTPTASAGAEGSPIETPSSTPAPEQSPDPRWRFFVADETAYASPWYDGRGRLMIDFGCTPAPYYRADARCRGGQGFHHGIDVAIPCGVTLRAGVAGRIVVGGLGAAYGENAFRIRTADHDLLVAHAEELLVADGDRVEVGRAIARNGALGAPDGCHLHLEQRAAGGGLSTATDPREVLALVP